MMDDTDHKWDSQSSQTERTGAGGSCQWVTVAQEELD